MLAGLKRINDTTFELSATSAPALRSLLTHGARFIPAVKDGKPNGVKVYAVRPGSLYAALGIKNGDTIHSIAGVDVTTDQNALDQLGKLPPQLRWSIVLTRRGKLVTLDYTVK